MLKYCKTILTKVSFDIALFEKELRKAIGILVPGEREELRSWCFVEFGQSQAHGPILHRYFS
ncbi:hypothetical protein FUAX_27680 [Fulvitalea axinellae]|uniref:Transposase n=1 Tax=Fulvitalea axinellae TaxID=1182444 RepID=A0AAU9CMQ1_9BACT|nr:hypothetical protein FUAX_27680 [Fulvitalea axinellae]